MSNNTHINVRDFWRELRGIPQFGSIVMDIFLLTLFMNILALALPLTTVQFFDRVLNNKSESTLFWLVSAVIVAQLTESFFKYLRTCVSSWLGAKYEYMKSCSVVERTLTSRLDAFEKDSIAAHLDQYKCITTLKGFYTGQIFQVAMDVPFAFLFLFVLWMVGGYIVIYAVLLAVLYFILFNYFQSHLKLTYPCNQEFAEKRQTLLLEILGKITFIKSLSCEDQMFRDFRRLQTDSNRAFRNNLFWQQTPNAFGGMFSQLMTFGVVLICGIDVIQGTMTFGALIASMMIAGRFMQPIQSIANFSIEYAKAKVDLEHLRALESLPSETDGTLPAFPDIIDNSVTLQNVNFGYEPGKLILKNLRFHAAAGEVVVITAGSGAGVGSLMNLIVGTLKPVSGDVLIGNYNLKAWDTTDYRGQIEYLPELPVLFDGSILDNITMFDPSRRACAFDTAAMLGLNEAVAQLPSGYETILNSQSSASLPRGLVHQIVTVRSLTRRPRILIANNTLSGLDEETAKRFLQLLHKLRGNTTVIIATHKTVGFDYADSVYALRDGTLTKFVRLNRKVKA